MHTILLCPTKSTLFPLLSSLPSAMSSSSSHLSPPSPSLNPKPNPNPNSSLSHLLLHRRHHCRTFKLSPIHFSSKQPPPPPPPPLTSPPPPSISVSDADAASENRSFAVVTGEFFLGIASRFIGGRKPNTEMEDEDEDGERIAAVIEDSVEPAVLWEQRVKDVEAENRRNTVTSPGFSFSAAAQETTPLAGSSAGAIVCAVIASGRTMEFALEATKRLADDCRLKGTAFRLGAILRDVLVEVLPDDIHTRCNGRVRVAVTQIAWRPRGLLVDQFDSKEDLINALFTSSFIPGYLAPRPVTMFRDKLCIDGGLTLFIPPTSASETVRVCAFPPSSLRMKGIGISPDCNPDNKLTNRQLLSWALEPAEDSMLDKLFEYGYTDAATWAKNNPANLVVHEDDISHISCPETG